MDRGSFHRLQPPPDRQVNGRGCAGASFRTPTQVPFGYERSVWGGGTPARPSRESSPAAVLRTTSSRSLATPVGVPPPMVSIASVSTAPNTTGGLLAEPVGAQRWGTPCSSGPIFAWPSNAPVSEASALMARVQSVSAKAETLLAAAGRGAGHSVMRQRSAFGVERLTDLTDRLVRLENLLDEVASLGPLSTRLTNGQVQRRPSGAHAAEAASVAAAAAAVASAAAGQGSSSEGDRGGRSGTGSVPVPVVVKTQSRSYGAPSGTPNGCGPSTAAPPPLTSRASGRFIEVQKAVAAAASSIAPGGQARGGGDSATVTMPLSGRATPPTPLHPPQAALVTQPSGIASPAGPLGPPPPIRGLGGYTPTAGGGLPGGSGPPAWLDSHQSSGSSATVSLTPAPAWMSAGFQTPTTQRSTLTPRAGVHTPRRPQAGTPSATPLPQAPLAAVASPVDVSGPASRAGSVVRHRRAHSAGPNGGIGVSVIPPAPAPVPMSVAFAPPADGLASLGGQVTLPPPPNISVPTPPMVMAASLLGTPAPPAVAGLQPPPGLGGLFMPSLSQLAQDTVESKLRQWLHTIPIGNGADRGWDDKQIAEIAQFAQDGKLENLDAEEIYKRYVEHQVEKAEEQAAEN